MELVVYLNTYRHDFEFNLSCQLQRHTRGTISYNGYTLHAFTSFLNELSSHWQLFPKKGTYPAWAEVLLLARGGVYKKRNLASL